MSQKILVIFPVMVLALVVLVLASHPLIDPDLGWNLTGGLWILDQGKIPTADPLAALASPWIDYCFLPQILMALVFKLSGFSGLLALQLIVPVIMFVCAGFFIFQNFDGHRDSLFKRILPVILAGTLALFIAPIFHLRPQLFSAFLFLLFLQWRVASKSNLILLLILIPWVNTHVYWIFAPVILVSDYILIRIFQRKDASAVPVILSLLVPLISPYGVKNYFPIIQYAFFHSHVKDLIQEFQPLLFTEGYLLPATCLLFAAVMFLAKRKLVRPEDFSLSLLLFVLSLWQMKFTPIFGIFGVIALARTKKMDGRIYSPKSVLAVYFLCIVFVLAASIFVSPNFGKNQEELLSIGKAASKINGPVFTQFNTGGWIELGIYLSNQESLAKPWMDGRTLVMGEKRLTDYFSVSMKQQSFEKYLDDNQMRYLILNKSSPLTPLIFPERSKLEFETENYFFLSRSLISASNS